MEKQPYENPWKVSKNVDCYHVWRYTRQPLPNEPMHSGLREVEGCFDTREEAQAEADRLNATTQGA